MHFRQKPAASQLNPLRLWQGTWQVPFHRSWLPLRNADVVRSVCNETWAETICKSVQNSPALAKRPHLRNANVVRIVCSEPHAVVSCMSAQSCPALVKALHLHNADVVRSVCNEPHALISCMSAQSSAALVRVLPLCNADRVKWFMIKIDKRTAAGLTT